MTNVDRSAALRSGATEVQFDGAGVTADDPRRSEEGSPVRTQSRSGRRTRSAS